MVKKSIIEKISIFDFSENLYKIIAALSEGRRGMTIDVTEKNDEFSTQTSRYRLNEKLIIVSKDKTIDGNGIFMSHKEMKRILGGADFGVLKDHLDGNVAFIVKSPILIPIRRKLSHSSLENMGNPYL